MHHFLSIAFIALTSLFAFGQNTKIEVTKIKAFGNDGGLNIFELSFKVISGTVTDRQPLVLQTADGKKCMTFVETYGDTYTTSNQPKAPISLRTAGCTPQIGQSLVSQDLIALPSDRKFEVKTNTAFLGNEPKEFFASIRSLKGTIKTGDEIDYINGRGQKGKGKIVSLEYKDIKVPALYEGVSDNFSMTILSTNGIDFSDANVSPAGSLGAIAAAEPAKNDGKSNSNTYKHKSKTFPINAVLENSEVKITVHNLKKFNPDPASAALDIFKVDYSLDYYIVDATVENKTNKELDAGEYLLRFNFFTADGKSADEFLRLFKNKDKPNDDVKNQANALDLNVFGGTSKIPMAAVLAKHQETIPNYDTEYKPNTAALNKKLKPNQKIRSIDATIMGVPPSYKIEGLGTWGGTFYNKKNLIFVPIKL